MWTSERNRLNPQDLRREKKSCTAATQAAPPGMFANPSTLLFWTSVQQSEIERKRATNEEYFQICWSGDPQTWNVKYLLHRFYGLKHVAKWLDLQHPKRGIYLSKTSECAKGKNLLKEKASKLVLHILSFWCVHGIFFIWDMVGSKRFLIGSKEAYHQD